MFWQVGNVVAARQCCGRYAMLLQVGYVVAGRQCCGR